jgi:hypothetical protein
MARGGINAFVVHHSECCGDLVSPDLEEASVRGIQNFHMDARAWNDIAYSFLVSPAGNVYEGRGWGVAHAANGDAASNRSTISICLLGAFSTSLPTVAAVNAARDLMASSGLSDLPVKGHRDYKSTSCPGSALYARLTDLSVWSAGLVPTWPFSHAETVFIQETLNRVTGSKLAVDGVYGTATAMRMGDLSRFFGLPDVGAYGLPSVESLELLVGLSRM